MFNKCKNCSGQFEIDQQDQNFYEKMKVPCPTLCPTCRMQRRVATRNDRFLYKSKSALTEDPIITMYNPKHGFIVYEHKEWWGDEWDPVRFGRDFDFNRSFFEQFAELQKIVPRFNLFNVGSENSDYVNYVTHSRNCYLTYGSWFNDDCMYSQTLDECKNCMDNLFLGKSELCYENIDCNYDFRAFFCQNCSNVSDSYFCFDCRGCRKCISCYNLRNKEYYINNKPATKEEFEETKKKFASYSGLRQTRQNFKDIIEKEAIHRDVISENNQNATGDLLFNCKNVKNCFSIYRSEDLAYCARVFDQKDSYDVEAGGKGELTYENMSNDFSYNSIGCTTCEYLTNSHYCDICFHCENCIGCVGLRHKKFCILNKQYTEKEYEKLSEEVMEYMGKTDEWGEFFPIKYSPFAYNETLAQEYYPLTKEEALQKGYKWADEEVQNSQPQTYKTPDNINDVVDEILDELLACKACGKNFKIVEGELKFYRKEHLPIPHHCPNCRHKARFMKRPPRHLWNSHCTKCGNPIITSNSPDKKCKIYCEQCYLKEVY
ncbi:MAG: hypothetical protein WC285_05615 [Candidatus Gracilibacteria bacterium]|jgi:hypothetical protein